MAGIQNITMVRETFHEDSMGDNFSVKSGDGDKGSGTVPSSRESSFMRYLRRAATSPNNISIEWLGKI